MHIYMAEKGEVLEYAASELCKYIEKMCGISPEITDKPTEEGITLATMKTLGISPDNIENPEIDDAYVVKINSLKGYIAGSNTRSILYGVYAYLKKAGCRFIRPGDDGEYIPKVNLAEFSADFYKKADKRYRCECIEGSVCYENLRDHIYWLPKMGYNGYMLQGTSPYLWYNRWYSHQGNPYLKGKELSLKEADEITLQIEKDIKRAGLLLHSVGHDYMAPAFGLYGDVTEEEIDRAGVRDYLALVDGERKIMHSGIRNTNMCYSNPYVRQKIVDFLVDYMKKKPYVDYLQLWFADNRNNFCECEKCLSTTISDQYVELLNMLDDAFSRNNIYAKIVFILYNDTCWAPASARLINEDRFVMMTAVRQNFIDGYTKYDPDIKVPEHLHNNYNVPPNHFPYTMGFLRDWKEVFSGDSFFFDYHLYSDHLTDPGYMTVAERIYEDVTLLDEFGSDGIMNCCTYRKQMPVSYPAYVCAMTLFDKKIDEKAVQKDYFTAAYGADSEKVSAYLEKLSKLFCSELLKDTGISAADEMFDDPNVQIKLPWMHNPAAIENFREIQDIVTEFLPVIEKNLHLENPCHRKSWEIILMHSDFVLKLSKALCLGAKGNMKEAQNECAKLIDYLARREAEYMPHLDFFLLMRRLRMMFGITNSIFAPA